jgi:Methyltransferase domain
MQVSELSGHEIVCTSDLSQAILRAVPGLAVLHSDDEVVIVSMSGKDQEIAAYLAEEGHRLSPRFMDRFFFEVNEDDNVRQSLLTGFFNVLAPLYRELVDVDRNVQNIETLLTLIERQVAFRTDGLIVDLGSGIGLSREPASRRGLRVVGVDPCPSMRHLAGLNGLTAWGPGDVARLPSDSFQAAFASYVFHLIPESGLLRLIWHRIENGGVLAANFHKQQGIEQFRATMHALGGIPVALDAALASTRHGQYLAYKKP